MDVKLCILRLRELEIQLLRLELELQNKNPEPWELYKKLQTNREKMVDAFTELGETAPNNEMMENLPYYQGLLGKVDSLLKEVEEKGHEQNRRGRIRATTAPTIE